MTKTMIDVYFVFVFFTFDSFCLVRRHPCAIKWVVSQSFLAASKVFHINKFGIVGIDIVQVIKKWQNYVKSFSISQAIKNDIW